MNYYKELLETKAKVIKELTALKNTKIDGLTLSVGHEAFEFFVTPVEINGDDLHIHSKNQQTAIWVVDRLSAEDLFKIHNHIFNVSDNSIKYILKYCVCVDRGGVAKIFENQLKTFNNIEKLITIANTYPVGEALIKLFDTIQQQEYSVDNMVKGQRFYTIAPIK